jgi:hypothetical protein
MKRFLIFILFTKSIIAFSQTPCGDSSQNWHFEVGNTSVELIVLDSNLIDSATSVKSIVDMLSDFCSNISINGNTITANTKSYSFYDKTCGFTWGNTSGLLRNPVSFNIRIDFKLGKFKVHCSNFVTEATQVYGSSSGNMVWDAELYNRKGCIKALMPMDNFEFAICKLNKSFKLKKSIKSDW